MYITCQQCSTIFRFDEKLLKPTGSKVRCSECSNIFVAYPPAPAPVEDAPSVDAAAVVAAMAPASEAAVDQELEGIDLAELDSILEQDGALMADDDDDSQDGDEGESLDAFNEDDLDLDFEAALADDEEIAPAETGVAEVATAEEDDFDLDMDFDLDGEDGTSAGIAPEQAADAVETDSGEALVSAEHTEAMAGGLNDDIDMVLDDFEDALGEPEAGSDEAAELTDEDFNLDFELEAESSLEIEPAVAAEENTGSVIEGDDLDLGDLGDLDALLDEGGAEAPEAAEEIEELELSLDDSSDLDDAPVGDVSQPAVAGDDLDLGDLDALLDDDGDAETAEVEDVELSLDDEDAFLLDEEPPVEDTPIPEMAGDDLDLGDLDALLDDDGDAEPAEVEEMELSLDDASDDQPAEATPAESETAVSDDLDLDDLDDLLEIDESEDADEDMGIEEMELSLDDGADFTADEAPAMEAASDVADDDDLGLGDLDALLDADDSDDEQTAPADAELSLEADNDSLNLGDLNDLLEEDAPADEGDDLDLSLELESADEAPAEQKNDLEDLEFELDSEYENKPVGMTAEPITPQESAPETDEELDLSDIEQMLEDDTLVKPGGDDSDIDAEKWLDDDSADLGLGGEGEIDLSEIEEAIDAADTEIDGSGLLDEDDNLDLDLDLDSESAAADTEDLELNLEMESDVEPMVMEEDGDELDLSDLDLSAADEKASTTTETIDGGDIELEFQIEEDGPLLMADGALDEASASTTAAVSGATTDSADTEDFSLEETIATEPVKDTRPSRSGSAMKKKKSSKSLVFLFILALLGGGGYFGYDYIKKNDIQIPYLSEYINPKPKDPTGTLNLSTLEINSKFIENEKSGRLFIVTGKVRNGNTVPCKMVRLRGKLFTKGKILSKTEHSYAGVVLPDQELAAKGLVEIKKQLNSSLGAAAAVQVSAGQTVPFMVVFSELPENLDEFAIELVSATKIQ